MKTRTGSTEYSRQVLNDIRQLSAEEVLTIHGIEIREDKTVYDQAYDQTFTDIADWIAFSAQDEDNEFEKFGYNDDEYI